MRSSAANQSPASGEPQQRTVAEPLVAFDHVAMIKAVAKGCAARAACLTHVQPRPERWWRSQLVGRCTCANAAAASRRLLVDQRAGCAHMERGLLG